MLILFSFQIKQSSQSVVLRYNKVEKPIGSGWRYADGDDDDETCKNSEIGINKCIDLYRICSFAPISTFVVMMCVYIRY